MENGKLPGYNRIGKRGSLGTFPGVPLKRLNTLYGNKQRMYNVTFHKLYRNI
jgi:hypothetical protein